MFAFAFAVCDYFVHVECQDFAVADCKENATWAPGLWPGQVRHSHHWREGNLPNSSKCAVCKKSCWAGECLAGYKCEWCGLTCHAACHLHAQQGECTFGNLEPIYLPPHAVSIPRTEVPMEAIIGVQVRRLKDTMSREYSCRKYLTSTCEPHYYCLTCHCHMNLKYYLSRLFIRYLFISQKLIIYHIKRSLPWYIVKYTGFSPLNNYLIT